MYWSREIKRRAAKLFEQGYGYKAVSTQLGVNRETTRDCLIPGERLVAKCYAGSMNQKATVLKSNLLL